MRAILVAVAWAGVLALPASAFAELIHDSDASHTRRGTPQRDAIYGHAATTRCWESSAPTASSAGPATTACSEGVGAM
jgi:hypothetical protein